MKSDQSTIIASSKSADRNNRKVRIKIIGRRIALTDENQSVRGGKFVSSSLTDLNKTNTDKPNNKELVASSSGVEKTALLADNKVGTESSVITQDFNLFASKSSEFLSDDTQTQIVYKLLRNKKKSMSLANENSTSTTNAAYVNAIPSVLLQQEVSDEQNFKHDSL
jgi:hypothetical protein